MNNIEKFEKIIQDVIKKNNIYGAVFNISNGDQSQTWIGASGNMNKESKYYIASINKFFISSIILRLINEKKISFDDSISRYISKDSLEGLHMYKGKDYSDNITIQHMLTQTSGLPCYLSDKPAGGVAGIKELEAGRDIPWPTDKVIERVKNMEPHFIPGSNGRAKYVDTNHQLLNLVIEKVMEIPVVDAINSLFYELDMQNSHVCQDPSDKDYIFPYYKGEERDISQFITSTNNDIISTAEDQMKFIKAFFNGQFYPKDKLKELEVWRPIFFPFMYGIGIQKFYMPRYLSPLKAVPDMIGHCGSTGSVAFYIPDLDIYITGTTNQQASPNIAFQTIIKMIHSME